MLHHFKIIINILKNMNFFIYTILYYNFLKNISFYIYNIYYIIKYIYNNTPYDTFIFYLYHKIYIVYIVKY